jgi:hypothetical protein
MKKKKRATGKPRGRTPSLISSDAGGCRILDAPGLRHCTRCHGEIPSGSRCVEVARPGTMGARTYCTTCFEKTLERTVQHVHELREKLNAQPPCAI